MTTEIDALLLAAGLGTRLLPLTRDIPKALLPVCGWPILDLHLERLLGRGGPARRVVVNTHHLAWQVEAHIARHPLRDSIRISHEPEILGTGGAIPRAIAHLRSDPILLVNTDALIDPPLDELLAFHDGSRCEGTLLLVSDPFAPNVHVEDGKVTRIAGRREEGAFTFTGCQILSQAFVRRIPREGFHDIRVTYAEAIRDGRLAGFVWDPGRERPFLDIGTPALYLRAHRLAAEGKIAAIEADAPQGRPAKGFGWIDSEAEVGPEAEIEESVVLGGARVGAGVRIRRSIVGPGAIVESDLDDLLVSRSGVKSIEDAGA